MTITQLQTSLDISIKELSDAISEYSHDDALCKYFRGKLEAFQTVLEVIQSKNFECRSED